MGAGVNCEEKLHIFSVIWLSRSLRFDPIAFTSAEKNPYVPTKILVHCAILQRQRTLASVQKCCLSAL